MADLYGVLELISTYPVHIMTFVGCLLLLGLVLPKRKRRYKHLSISPKTTAEKREFTQQEKHLIVEKINENRMNNLKKTSAIDENSNYMIYATIILIALSILFFVGILVADVRKHFLILLFLFIIGVILMKLRKYIINLWHRKKTLAP